jgi:hypothetical protein
MPKKMQIKNYQTSDLEIDATGGAVVLKDGGATKLTTTDSGIAITGEVLFQNVYATLNDLPNASENHGMFAHVHATGAAYFAHSGAWVQLANNADIGGGGGGSGMASRSSPSAATASIADNVSTDIDITGFKGYALYSITTSAAAWVTLYTSNAARQADNSRAETSDPAPDAGIIAEVITSSSQLKVLISPGTIGYNLEATPTTNIPVKVRNRSGSTAAITVAIEILQLEA